MSGTYIAICNSDDKVLKVEEKENGYHMSGTKNKNDENAEVRTIPTPTGIFYSYSLVAC